MFFDLFSRLAKHHVSLEKFVIEHDAEVYGRNLLNPQQVEGRTSIQELEKLVHIRIDNSFLSVSEFHAHLDSLDLLNVDRLRPQWDTYFMVRKMIPFLSPFLSPFIPSSSLLVLTLDMTTLIITITITTGIRRSG